jgi:hypothetical protein
MNTQWLCTVIFDEGISTLLNCAVLVATWRSCSVRAFYIAMFVVSVIENYITGAISSENNFNQLNQ